MVQENFANAPRSSGALSLTSARKSAAGLSIKPKVLPAIASATVAEWTPKKLEALSFPDRASGHGAPPPTVDNVAHLLSQNNIRVQYDVIKKKNAITIPGLPGVTDNIGNVTIAHVKSLLSLHGMQTGDINGVIEAIGNRNPYNPVEAWISSKPWDGEDRLPSFYATLRAKPDYPERLKRTLMRKWLLSATAAALMKTGFSTRGVLTLQGAQSIGKSRWGKSLVPDPLLRDAVVLGDHHFKSGDKDSLITAVRFWIVELGELESSLKKDKDRLKGTITRDRDTVRLPYAAADSEFPRRTVFYAMANGYDFLNDPTGSTRFYVIDVESIDYEHSIDMQQLFAQMAVRFQAGEKWWLDADEEQESAAWNERHQATSIVREHLSKIIDFDGEDVGETRRMTATEVLKAAGIHFPTNGDAKECAAILRAKLGDASRIRGYMKWAVQLRVGVDRSSLPDDHEHRKSKFD